MPSQLHIDANVLCDTVGVTVDPCYHTLCTVVQPRLTTPVFVQYELSTPAQRRDPSDVFALHADESSSISKGLVPLAATD